MISNRIYKFQPFSFSMKNYNLLDKFDIRQLTAERQDSLKSKNLYFEIQSKFKTWNDGQKTNIEYKVFCYLK